MISKLKTLDFSENFYEYGGVHIMRTGEQDNSPTRQLTDTVFETIHRQILRQLTDTL